MARRTLWLLGAILVVAAGLRLAYLAELRGSVYYRAPLIDAWEYHRDARLIAQHGQAARIPFWHPPLYPYLLAGIYVAAGDGPLAPRLANFALGLASCGLLFGWARRAAGDGAALAATALFGWLPLVVFFEGQLSPVPLAIALDLLLLAALERAGRTGRPTWAALAGAALGLAALAIPTVLLFGLAGGIWLAGSIRGRGRGRAIGPAAAYALAAVLVILPVTVRNYLVSGELVPISTNGGVNFYLGNNERSEETIDFRPGSEWEALIRSAGPVSDGEASRVFFRRALTFLVRQPAEAARLYLRKTARLFSNLDLMRNQDIAWQRRQFAVLGLPFPGFGTLAALALVGFPLIGPRRNAAAALAALFAAAYAAGVLAFFVTARYRLPLVPALAVPAGALLAAAAGWVRRREWRRLAGRALPAVVLAGLAALPLVDRPGIRYRDVHMNLADAYERTGQPEKTAAALRQAMEADPAFPDAPLRLGNMALAAGRLDEALDHFEQAERLRPDSEKPPFDIGLVHARAGRPTEAAAAFRRALARWPHDPEIRLNLGRVLLQLGDSGAGAELEEARRAYRRRLADQPFDAEGWRQLGIALVLLRQPAEAAPAFARALALAPGDAEAASSLAELALAAGRLGEAEQAARAALHARPGEVRALSVLGSVLLGRGRLAEALETFSRAVELAPEDGLLRNRLAVALLAAGRPAEARRQAERALALGARLDPDFLAALGMGT